MQFPSKRKLNCLSDGGSPEIFQTMFYVQGSQSMHLQGSLFDMGLLTEECSENKDSPGFISVP